MLGCVALGLGVRLASSLPGMWGTVRGGPRTCGLGVPGRAGEGLAGFSGQGLVGGGGKEGDPPPLPRQVTPMDLASRRTALRGDPSRGTGLMAMCTCVCCVSVLVVAHGAGLSRSSLPGGLVA